MTTTAANGLHDWDAAWSRQYEAMVENPWRSGVVPAKEIELICVGLRAAITNLNSAALRTHVRAALGCGATPAEIAEVLKMAAVLSLHSMSLGATVLIEELGDAKPAAPSSVPDTPACDRLRTIGQWNVAWDPFYALDPLWTEQFIACGIGFYTNGVLTPKFVELISIAFDASVTHMYAPGTRRHIRAALALGATVEEIMTVLKLCVSMGADALAEASEILARETAARP
jgi:alkylhydroperoxidase/carboxymuconolactone decarboxylase family protein YurZ